MSTVEFYGEKESRVRSQREAKVGWMVVLTTGVWEVLSGEGEWGTKWGGWVRWRSGMRAFQEEGRARGKPSGVFEGKEEGQWGWAELRRRGWSWSGAGSDVVLSEVEAVGGF